MRRLWIGLFLVVLGVETLWAQTSSVSEFYNRDSSGYSYRIGPVLPPINNDWQLGSLPSQFGLNLNPSGINIQNYIQTLLQMPELQTSFQQYTGTPLYNDFLLRAFQNPTSASVLSNVTSLMNQQVTIRMLQDIMRRLQLGPDPAASMQAGSQQRCVQLAAVFGIMSPETAERVCSGGPGGNSRGIVAFGTPSTTQEILSTSQLPADDQQLIQSLMIDFKSTSTSGSGMDSQRVMPQKSVSDVRRELEEKICQEVRAKVQQASQGNRAGGPLSMEGTVPLTAETLFSISRMESAKKELSIQSVCRQQSLVATRAKMLRLTQRFSQALEGGGLSQNMVQPVREEYRGAMRRLLDDVDLMAKQMEFEERTQRDILSVGGEQKRTERRAAGTATSDTRAGGTLAGEEIPKTLVESLPLGGKIGNRLSGARRPLVVAGVLLLPVIVGLWFVLWVGGWIGARPEKPVTVKVVSLAIQAEKRDLKAKERIILRLKGKYPDGSEGEITQGVEWRSSNTSVATVSPRGQVEALAGGNVDITARYGGIAGSPLTLFVKGEEVKPPVGQPGPAAQVVSLTVDADRRELRVKDRVALRARGRYSDGSEGFITKGVDWQTSDRTVVTINSKSQAEGRREGSADVTARYGEIASSPLTLVVKAPEPPKTREPPNGRIKDHIKIARFYRERGEYADAFSELQKASGIDPNNRDVRAEVENTRKACLAEKKLGRAGLPC